MRTNISSGRVGKAIVPTCFFYGRLRPAQEIGGGFSHGRRSQWVKMLTMGTAIFGLHLLIVVAAIAQSYLIKCCSESVEKYSKAGSIRVSLNQGMANYVILSTLLIRGIPLKSVARSLFTHICVFCLE